MADILEAFYIQNDSEVYSDQQDHNEQKILYEEQIFSLGQSNYNMNNALILQVEQIDFHQEKPEPNITASTYCNTIVQQNEKKIQFQQFVTESFYNRKDSKYYIQQLEKKIRSKMNEENQKYRQKNKKRKNIKQYFNDTIPITKQQISKTKQIKKQKNKHNSTKILSQELGITKKHLSKLWCSKIVYFLRAQNIQKQTYNNVSITQIQGVKKFLSKSSITIKQLSSMLKSHEWLRKLIYEEELKDDKPLEIIYNATNLTDQSKLIMLQTYDIFKEAIKNPNMSITWDHNKQIKINQSLILLERCKNKSLQFILNVLNEFYEKQIQQYSKNKCSKQNNISYCWNAYLKEIANQTEFIKNIQQEKLQNLRDQLQKPASITNIKNILQFNQFSRYILDQKIKTNKIIQEILVNTKINILNKKNMMESYLCFCSAVEQPQILKNWPKISN